MKKKMYTPPCTEVMAMEPCCMIAASEKVNVFTEEEIDASASLSNNRRGIWGNLWDDGE